MADQSPVSGSTRSSAHAELVQASILIVGDDAARALETQTVLAGVAGGVEVLSTRPDPDIVRAVGARRPDLVIVLLPLAAGDGVALTARIQSRYAIPVVCVAADADGTLLHQVKRVEPAAYVAAPFTEEQLRGTIEVTLYRVRRRKGLHRRSPAYLDQVLDRAVAIEETLRRISAITPAIAQAWASPDLLLLHPRFARLSPRERDVLRLLASNRRIAAIAQELDIEPNTARSHLKAIYKKTGLHSQAELLQFLVSIGTGEARPGN